MKHYYDLYLKFDLLLLPDVFELFISSSLKYYELCPSCYLSAPALSCDAIFNVAKIEFELSSDLYLHLFFESMRGAVCSICKRYSKTSNKCLKSFDSKQE